MCVLLLCVCVLSLFLSDNLASRDCDGFTVVGGVDRGGRVGGNPANDATKLEFVGVDV